MSNFDQFMEIYASKLRAAVREYPDDYMFLESKVPDVVEKMKVAFKEGSYNKDGRAIKNTCKTLKIKYTYQGINAFLKGESS